MKDFQRRSAPCSVGPAATRQGYWKNRPSSRTSRCAWTARLAGAALIVSGWLGPVTAQDRAQEDVPSNLSRAGRTDSSDPSGLAAWEVAEDRPAEVTISEIEQLINQLGDDSFIQRERAMKQLLAIGDGAIGLLRASTTHADREIRTRSRHLLAEIDLLNRRQRIQEFLSGTIDTHDIELPGWRRLRDTLGDSPPVRQVFAEMLEDEWDLLAATDPTQASHVVANDSDPTLANNRMSDVFNSRVMEMFQESRMRQAAVADAAVAALILAGLDEKVQVTAESHSYISSMCYRLKVPTQAVAESDDLQTRDDVVRGLLSAWIRKDVSDHGTYLNLNLALRFDLADGLQLAEEILQNPASPVDRKIMSMLTVVRFGDQRHKLLLESFLNDKTVSYQEKDPQAKSPRFQMQVRDVALAGLMKLDGMDPQQHGFERLRTNPYTVYITNTIGFTDDEKRTKAFQVWRDHAQPKLRE